MEIYKTVSKRKFYRILEGDVNIRIIFPEKSEEPLRFYHRCNPNDIYEVEETSKLDKTIKQFEEDTKLEII